MITEYLSRLGSELIPVGTILEPEDCLDYEPLKEASCEVDMNKRLLGFKAGVSGGGIPETQINDAEYLAGHADGQRAAKWYQIALEIGSDHFLKFELVSISNVENELQNRVKHQRK